MHKLIITVLGSAAAVASTLLMSPASSASAVVPLVPIPVVGTLHASWPLNQVSGPIALDITARGHDGLTDLRAPEVSFAVDALLKRNVAVFANDDGRILVPPSADLSPGTHDFAVGISVRTLDAHSNIFQAGTTRTGQHFIKIEMASAHTVGIVGVPRCRFTGSTVVTGDILLGDRSVADGKWHTIRCDKTATWIVMRVDGVVVKSRPISVGTIDVSLRQWSIGGKYLASQVTDPGDMFTGSLANAFVLIKD